MGDVRERPRIAQCVPLKGIHPLVLGMTLGEATRVMGLPDHVFAHDHEASWRPGFRCYFSDHWVLLQISIVDSELVPIHIGRTVLPRNFAEAETQLVRLIGTGHRDPQVHLTVFPTHGLEIWSEDGEHLDDFGCTTPERIDVIWSDWRSTYVAVRPPVSGHL